MIDKRTTFEIVELVVYACYAAYIGYAPRAICLDQVAAAKNQYWISCYLGSKAFTGLRANLQRPSVHEIWHLSSEAASSLHLLVS